jgi:hypothetical protein
MPDNDIVPRAVRGVWRRAAKAAIGGLSASEVGDELRLALAKAVRDDAPPSAGPLVVALQESVAFRESERWERAVADWVDRCGRTDLAFAIVRQGEMLREVRRDEIGAMSDAQLETALVGDGLRRWVDMRVFGPERMLSLLVDQRLASPAEARRYQQACLDHASIDEIGAQLVRGEGDGVRAPRTKDARPPMADMLNEEVE